MTYELSNRVVTLTDDLQLGVGSVGLFLNSTGVVASVLKCTILDCQLTDTREFLRN